MSAASKNTIEFPAPGTELDASAGGSAPQVSAPVSWEIPVRIYGPRGSVVVSGRTEQTEPFLEETHTLILFPQGAVIRLSASVTAGQSLLLTNEQTNREVMCRVTSVRAAANGLAYVEFEFTKPQDSFWGEHCPSGTPAPESAPAASDAPAVAHTPVAAPVARTAAQPAVQRVEGRQKEANHEGQSSARTREELPPATGHSQALPQAVPQAVAPVVAPPLPVSAQITSSPIAPPTPQSSRDVWNESFPSKALRLDTVPAAPAEPAAKKRPAGTAEARKATKPAGNFITPSAIGAISAAADSVISAEMAEEAPTVAEAPPPPPPVQSSSVNVAKERAPRERERAPQPVAAQAANDSATSLFAKPTGEGFHSAARSFTGTSSPRAIGDSLGDLGDWKVPPQVPPSSGRSSVLMDFGSRTSDHSDQYGMVTQVEEERDPKRMWIFGGVGVGVVIILSILMFSNGPAKTVTSAGAPGTEEVSALQPPKPPSVWDAKSFVSTSRSDLATPGSKKAEPSDNDVFLSDPPPVAKSASRDANPEPPARTKQEKQPAQIERPTPAAVAAKPAPVAALAPRQESSASLPESTMRKLSSQPAVPERSVEQNRVRQTAAAPPEVRETPPSAPQSGGLSGISPAPAPTPAAEAPAPAPVSSTPAPSRQQDAAPQQPLRVGGKIKAPQLVHSVPPQYPIMARQAHVDGDVVVDMVIDASGKVTTMKVVSGPLLLRDAATAALRQWQYKPTLLNEQPVPVEMEVLIKFKM